jgi:hypothetical protein
MEKNTPYLVMLMAGLLLGRLVSFQHLKIVEITGLLFLAFCYRGDILNGLRRLATRPKSGPTLYRVMPRHITAW